MKMWVATIVVAVFAAAEVVSARNFDSAVRSCPEGEFFDKEERICEPCSECTDFLYEREPCSKFKDTICGWCGSKKPLKNFDYYRKCTKQQDAFDEEKFEREFKARVMSRILEKGDKEDVSGETDHDEHKATDRLPPLPTDDEYDDEYYDDDVLDSVHEDTPSSEEELERKEIVDREQLKSSDDSDEFEEELEEKAERTKKRDFAPISGDEFLRRERLTVDKETEEELEQDGVRPVNVNEAKIDEEDDVVNEMDELLDSDGHRINIVAIAVRKREEPDKAEDEVDHNASSYSSICHTTGFYIYAFCLGVLAAVTVSLIKRYKQPVYHVPIMNFTEEQRAMMQRCAEQMKNKKEDMAIYENDLAYV
ncbi:unnamed protein product [Cylicocyclus nassatus]|uniref:TNFR-Cys domain-containing protein n=1 Tax=Cylicocyclus nassatus TaxID=53992 RepID=A0AA36HG59_CYLNA|nr:unnamed protein product [Cylicocyclus nassatus]